MLEDLPSSVLAIQRVMVLLDIFFIVFANKRILILEITIDLNTAIDVFDLQVDGADALLVNSEIDKSVVDLGEAIFGFAVGLRVEVLDEDVSVFDVAGC